MHNKFFNNQVFALCRQFYCRLFNLNFICLFACSNSFETHFSNAILIYFVAVLCCLGIHIKSSLQLFLILTPQLTLICIIHTATLTLTVRHTLHTPHSWPRTLTNHCLILLSSFVLCLIESNTTLVLF